MEFTSAKAEYTLLRKYFRCGYSLRPAAFGKNQGNAKSDTNTKAKIQLLNS